MGTLPGRVGYGLHMDTVRVIDSHTEGEPTRVVIEGGPDRGTAPSRNGPGSSATNTTRSVERSPASRADTRRWSVRCWWNAGSRCGRRRDLLQQRGHAPHASGTIGVTVTLAHLGRIGPGSHRFETPVGPVVAHLGEDGLVSVENVPSWRQRSGVRLRVDGLGTVTGDVAWGGNWFFLVGDHGIDLAGTGIEEIRNHALAIANALERDAVHGVQVDPETGNETYHVIDHVELFDRPTRADCDSRNFVLCPGGEYDRSPCGTGTSAKLACLHADGLLRPGDPWAQESIIGSRIVGRCRVEGDTIVPTITGGPDQR